MKEIIELEPGERITIRASRAAEPIRRKETTIQLTPKVKALLGDFREFVRANAQKLRYLQSGETTDDEILTMDSKKKAMDLVERLRQEKIPGKFIIKETEGVFERTEDWSLSPQEAQDLARTTYRFFSSLDHDRK